MPALALFLYHHTTKANAVKFMHQSLCNPPITSLLNTINAGFLQGAPHLNAKSVQKYLTPSPATLKGHMKRPRKSLWSTTPKPTCPSLPHPPSNNHPFMPGLIPDDSNEDDEDKPRPAFINYMMINPSPMYFVLAPLPTKTPVSSTTTAPATSPLCCLMATYIFL
jgi:hypothetical protein